MGLEHDLQVAVSAHIHQIPGSQGCLPCRCYVREPEIESCEKTPISVRASRSRACVEAESFDEGQWTSCCGSWVPRAHGQWRSRRQWYTDPRCPHDREGGTQARSCSRNIPFNLSKAIRLSHLDGDASWGSSSLDSSMQRRRVATFGLQRLVCLSIHNKYRGMETGVHYIIYTSIATVNFFGHSFKITSDSDHEASLNSLFSDSDGITESGRWKIAFLPLDELLTQLWLNVLRYWLPTFYQVPLVS